MIKTPLTKRAFDRVQYHQQAALAKKREAKAMSGLVRRYKGYLFSPFASLVWSFAAGAWVGSKRTAGAEHGTKTTVISSGTASLLSLLGTALSLFSLTQKVELASNEYNKMKIAKSTESNIEHTSKNKQA